MDTKQRKIFDAYFQVRVERESAFSIGDKLELARRMYREAAEEGKVPVAPNRIAKVNVDTPRVRAILAGREVAIGGVQVQGQSTLRQRLAELPIPMKLGLVLFLAAIPVLVMLVAGKVAGQSPKMTATITSSPTNTPTVTLTPTPEKIYPTATPYDLVLDSAGSPSGPNDPVSVAFASIAFSLKQAKLKDGEWLPAVAEWLPGTELRRVIAVPYTQEVGDAVGGMTYGDDITLRLRSGEVVKYRLTDILRLKRYEIECMNSLRPSIVVILHGERSGDRWVLVADVEQDRGLPPLTPTPTATPTASQTPSLTPTFTPTYSGTVTLTATPTPTETPTPTATVTPSPTATPTNTATPSFAFTPPVPVKEIITDTLTVTNDDAGLELSVRSCSEVVQIGASSGNFVVCDVILTAVRSNVAYSGDTLAITKRVQVEKVPGWWPPPLSVIGAVGSGGLARIGDTVSGRVAGDVAHSKSDPVLLWEQNGLRFVIILSDALDK